MKIKAFAKVNLYLDIIGKRADGYHELVTLMCPINLHDTIHLSFETSDIRVACNHPDVPDSQRNIAHTAARRFLRYAGRSNDGVRIKIEKNIPVGAGLGGGSSNAAAVLTGLNTYYGSPLSLETLLEIGQTIGADVPFFIYGKPAIATGIGEIITLFEGLPPLPLVLIYPGVILSTIDVYKNFNLGLTKNEKIHTKNIFKLDWNASAPKLLFNALENVAFGLCPEVMKVKEKLLESGAEGALMSGSGSSVYGIYKDGEASKNAFHRLQQQKRWKVFNTRLLI